MSTFIRIPSVSGAETVPVRTAERIHDDFKWLNAPEYASCRLQEDTEGGYKQLLIQKDLGGNRRIACEHLESLIRFAHHPQTYENN